MSAMEAKKFAEKEIKAGRTPTYEDLRDWLEIVDGMGELKKIDGADWNLEMGTLAELVARQLSDRESDPVFRQGMAVAQNLVNSLQG